MTHSKKFVSVLVILSFFLFFGMESHGSQKPSSSPKLININTAGVGQLVKLPRIGEKTAKQIIEYRNKNGKFKRIQDLMKVKGIGEKTFKKLEHLITV